MTYQRPSDLINRNRPLTGRALFDAMQGLAGRKIIGQQGLSVDRNAAGDAIISDTRIFPRVMQQETSNLGTSFMIRIFNPSSLGLGTNRWQYQARRIGAKDGSFAGYDGGDISFLAADPAEEMLEVYNFAELDNDGTGVEGNGVDITSATATIQLQPATYGPTDTRIVEARSYLIDGGITEWWFHYPNPVTVTCVP